MKKNDYETRSENKKKLFQEKMFRMFPSYRNNLSTMKLLATSSVFQKIVEDTRNYLMIPRYGMIHNDALIKKWIKKMDTMSDEKLSSQTFQDQTKGVFERVKNKEISRAMARKQLKLIDNNILWNRLTYTVDYIIDKFNLPLNFSDYIRKYILFNEISAPFNNFIVGPWPKGITSISNLPYLPITIYAKLTNKELAQIKKETETNLAKRLPRYREIKDIDRQIELDDWNRHKSTFDEVERETYSVTAKEISKDVFKRSDKAQRVYDSTRGLKKLRKKRFGTE
jgi:hypothetical protein